MSVPRPIPVEHFGRDHWSTLLYIETRWVDHGGVPDKRHMRCDPLRHPGHAHRGTVRVYPTYLKDSCIDDHDDWDCVDDFIALGWIEDRGTGMNPVWWLTDKGIAVAHALRVHRARKGDTLNFTPPREAL